MHELSNFCYILNYFRVGKLISVPPKVISSTSVKIAHADAKTINPMTANMILLRAFSILPLSPPAVIMSIPPQIKYPRTKTVPTIITKVTIRLPVVPASVGILEYSAGLKSAGVYVAARKAGTLVAKTVASDKKDRASNFSFLDISYIIH